MQIGILISLYSLITLSNVKPLQSLGTKSEPKT